MPSGPPPPPPPIPPYLSPWVRPLKWQNGSDATLNEAHAFVVLGEGEHITETFTSIKLRSFLAKIHLANKSDPLRFPFVAWVLFKYNLSPEDLFVIHTDHQHAVVKETHAAMTAYQQLLASESARLSQIDMLRIDAEAGGLDGGRAMVKLKLLENTEKEERVVMEVKLKVAQRAAAKYLKENNPFEQEKAAAQARADGIVADAAAKRSASKSKIAALHAKMGLDQ